MRQLIKHTTILVNSFCCSPRSETLPNHHCNNHFMLPPFWNQLGHHCCMGWFAHELLNVNIFTDNWSIILLPSIGSQVTELCSWYRSLSFWQLSMKTQKIHWIRYANIDVLPWPMYILSVWVFSRAEICLESMIDWILNYSLVCLNLEIFVTHLRIVMSNFYPGFHLCV
jgi:hypothetical protein